jgi:hypothetical protein
VFVWKFKSLLCKTRKCPLKILDLKLTKIVRRGRIRTCIKLLNGESRSKMAPDDKERPLPASLPTPSKEEDTTVETLGEMMARLKILEEVQAENKALVQELKEIREERKSEGVSEKPPVFPDDPFAHIKPAHKRTTRKAKHGYGTRTLSRSLGGDFEEEEYYASRRPYKANTGRTGHIEHRSVQEDPFVHRRIFFSNEGGFGKKRGRWGELAEPLHDHFCTQCLPGRGSYARTTREETTRGVSRE